MSNKRSYGEITKFNPQLLQIKKHTIICSCMISALKAKLSKDVTDLSRGQRTKVLLAKLLLENPDILLLGEPTNYLDEQHIEKQLEAAYKRQQQEISKLKYFVARNKARVATSNMAKSRQKKLDKMDILKLAPKKFIFWLL